MINARSLAALALFAMFFSTHSSVASAGTTPDWAITQVAPAPGTTVSVQVGAALTSSGTGPFVLGSGSGTVSGSKTPIQIFVSSGGATVSTSGTPITDGLLISRSSSGGSTTYILHRTSISQTTSFLFFTANGTLANPYVYLDDPDAQVTVSTELGVGSEAIYLADPRDQGVAATLGSNAAGTSIHTEHMGIGLAGALSTENCDYCSYEVTRPDGYTFSSARVSIYSTRLVIGPGSFSGGAGSWTWSWAGVDAADYWNLNLLHRPVLAAYAPVGDKWTLFADEGE